MPHSVGSDFMHRALSRDMIGVCPGCVGAGSVRDTRENWMGETVQTVTFLASLLMSLALVIGCADSAEQRLRQMGVLFKTASLKEIRVIGHADKASASDGSNQYFKRLALSKARATQTVGVLKGDGVDSQSYIIEWYGDIRPIATNETEEGRQMNRRVEIVLFA